MRVELVLTGALCGHQTPVAQRLGQQRRKRQGEEPELNLRERRIHTGSLETNAVSGQGRKHRREKEFLEQKSSQLG